MSFPDALLAPIQKYETALPNCQCCPTIKPIGTTLTRPFLQAADDILTDYHGRYLSTTETKLFPPVLKHVGVSQVGFEAEFKVFGQLRNSHIPMYVFHSWKPIDCGEETADFLVVTNNTVVSLEVKAFDLVQNPAQENIDTFNKVLMKSLEQQSKVRHDFKKFLEDHGFVVGDVSEVPLVTFTLFPTAMDKEHHVSNIACDFEDRLAKNSNVDEYTSSNFEDRILFNDDYVKKLKEIVEDDSAVSDEKEIQLRSLLAWFYGTYSYVQLATSPHSVRSPGKLEFDESYKLGNELNIAHMKIKTQAGGVFLTQTQDEIVKCNQNFLAIVGFPGTGKTYCLIAKILDVVKEKMKSYTGPEEPNEIIAVVHNSDLSCTYMKNVIMKSLSEYYNEQELQRVEKLLQFIQARSLRLSERRFRKDQRLLVFYDDMEHCYYAPERIDGIMQQIDFFWYTRYSVIPWVDQLPRPFCQLEIDGDLISESDKFSVVDQAVRFSAQIFKLVQVITENMKKPVSEYYEGSGPRRTSSFSYCCGTRVVGDDVKFVPLEWDVEVLEVWVCADYYELKAEELSKFAKAKDILTSCVLQEVSLAEEFFTLDEIWILALAPCTYEVLLEGLNEKGSNLKPVFFEDARGKEQQCVIIVFDYEFLPEYSDYMEILLDAVTRAISKVVIVYRKGNIVFDNMVEQISKEAPVICTSAIKSKKLVTALRSYEPCSLFLLLTGDDDYFRMFNNFVYDLHNMRTRCFSDDESDVGLFALCRLTCANESLKMMKIVSESPIFDYFQKACHYAWVSVEAGQCYTRLRAKSSEKSEESMENIQRRMNHCLKSLIGWMKNIKEKVEPSTGSVSSLVQYKRAFQIFYLGKKEIDLKAFSRTDVFLEEETRKLLLEIKELNTIYQALEAAHGFSG